jgi:hypothetical protein
MRLFSWSVKGSVPYQGSPDRIDSQVEYIAETAGYPNPLMVNEFSSNPQELRRDNYEHLGYTQIVETLDWANELGQSIFHSSTISRRCLGLTTVHEDNKLDQLERQRPSI